MRDDRERSLSEERTISVRRADVQYAGSLRQVAAHVGQIINGMAPNGVVESASDISLALQRYAEALRPWARAVAWRMLQDVERRDARVWHQMSEELGRNMRAEIRNAPTGDVMRMLLGEQVGLITSLPIEAAQRVHHLAMENLSGAQRPEVIAAQIRASGGVTASRAQLIARTETARAATTLNQARAQHVGSTHFIWRTAGDSDVRSDHRKLNGKTFAWSDPPIADAASGARALPGAIYNCRCYAEPIIPL